MPQIQQGGQGEEKDVFEFDPHITHCDDCVLEKLKSLEKELFCTTAPKISQPLAVLENSGSYRPKQKQKNAKFKL